MEQETGTFMFMALDDRGDERLIIFCHNAGSKVSDRGRIAAERLVNERGGAKVEFSRFVAALVHSCPDSLLGPHLRQAFDRLDIDGDGFVSTEELRQFLESGPCGAAAQVAAPTAASTSGRRVSLPSGAMHSGIGGGGGGMAEGVGAGEVEDAGRYVEVDAEQGPDLPSGLCVVACPGSDRRWIRKVLSSEGLPAATRQLVEAEGHVLRLLAHPGVVELRQHLPGGGSGDAGGEPALILEYLPGGDCSQLLAKCGPLPEVQAANLSRQVLEALSHCHGRGVVHRDVHPGNVVLADSAPRCGGLGSGGGRARCKLIDFGFAGRLPEGDDSGACMHEVVGNAPYMAPEMFARRPEYGAKVDVWSAGVLAFELLTGSPPFGREADRGGADPRARLFRRVRQYAATADREAVLEEAAGWKLLSRGARAFLLSLLQPDPELRPSAAEAARHPWLLLWGIASPQRHRSHAGPGRSEVVAADDASSS
mmetsp:Transcript_72140/g.203632  ORF Transcript_72140/g.203632 Transcript_72140/m.203632 type:complete len:480 (+) Transcript_72140:3-1442(+)